MIRPSKLERAVKCPGSISLEITMPEQASSAIADRGTELHELAAQKLADFCATGWDDTAAQLLPRDIASYVDYCFCLIREARRAGTEFGIEQEFRPPNAVGGTIDFFAIVGDTLHIVDLKTGYNTVSAEGNYQLHAYAVIVAKHYGLDFGKIKLVIFQKGVADIADFDGKLELEMAPHLFLKAEYPLNFLRGSWCAYCPCAALCPAARVELHSLELPLPAVTPELYELAKRAGKTAETIKDEAKLLAEKGTLGGYAIKMRRGPAAWSQEAKSAFIATYGDGEFAKIGEMPAVGELQSAYAVFANAFAKPTAQKLIQKAKALNFED